MWGGITICAFLFVMTGESLTMFSLAPRITDYQLQWINIGFNIIWWIVPAYCLNMFIHRFVFSSMTQKEMLHVANIVPRFVSFLIYSIACLGIVAYVFEQEISRFLATGGIFAMMIGLAVKMNVADILSGIAINIESPFRQGDWIQIDQHEGMVIDITWRSTRVKTGENAVLCIPNSKATDSSIQNYNTPGELNWIKIKVPLSHLVSPEMVENILTAAVYATRDVITTPPPKIFYKGTTELNAWFDIFFCINDYASRKRRINDVWTSIWKHLRYAEMTLSMMGQSFRFPQQKLIDILNRLDILEGISIEDKLELVPHFKCKTFAAGQIIVDHQELKSDEFYIIRKGAVRVYFSSDDGTMIEVDRMGAGEYFGETGLLGEAYAAQIKAVTDVSIDAISGEILFRCVDDRKPFLDQLRHLRLRRNLARKQQKIQYEEAQAVKDKKKQSFLGRVFGTFTRRIKIRNK
jgi:branched-chain amino acid transport system substrate-binding protein